VPLNAPLRPPRTGSLLLPVVLLASACAREAAPRGPQRLLEMTADGFPAQVAEVEREGMKRRALVASARYRVYLPREALLVFSLAALSRTEEAARGFFELRVRADGREVAEHRINVRTAQGFRDSSLPFEGPGRTGLLELELSYRSGGGKPRSLPAEITLAVADPMLLDLGPRGDRRGVLFISIDTLRRDHVGLYGYAKPTTPNLDALGRQGLVGDDAVSVSCWTLPAHFSMMTSVEPAAHGATNFRVGFNHRVPTLARMFRDAGFSTHAITSNPFLSKTYGFDDGFDSINQVFNRRAADTVDRALAFLDHAGSRPFFLLLHFFDPHINYDPDVETLRIFEPEPYRGRRKGVRRALQNMTPENTRPEDLAHILALYDAEIRYADGELGRLFSGLAARGLDRTTLVLLTSDHGEEFLDHGGWQHLATLYEELIRVPLILRGPGIEAGQRLATQLSHLDLAPTVLDWARLPPLPTQRGHSLLRSLPPEREAYGETDLGLEGTRKLYLRGGAGKWKTILSLERMSDHQRHEEWYDLASDPRETDSKPPPEAAASGIRDRLFKQWRNARHQGGGGQPVDLSPAQIEQLRALGYIQ